MGRLIYAMSASLDGFAVGRDGDDPTLAGALLGAGLVDEPRWSIGPSSWAPG